MESDEWTLGSEGGTEGLISVSEKLGNVLLSVRDEGLDMNCLYYLGGHTQ